MMISCRPSPISEDWLSSEFLEFYLHLFITAYIIEEVRSLFINLRRILKIYL